jgi:hypothetical protein
VDMSAAAEEAARVRVWRTSPISLASSSFTTN